MPVKYSIVKDQTSSVLLVRRRRKSGFQPMQVLKNSPSVSSFSSNSLTADRCHAAPSQSRFGNAFLVGLDRLELSTSPLSGVRSSHLSYRPGLWSLLSAPPTWWSWSGSNRRPPECKSGALPAELQPLLGDLGLGIREQARCPRQTQDPSPQPRIMYRGRLDAASRRLAELTK